MTTYELHSNKIKGDFTISFKDGYLNAVKMEFTECLNAEQHAMLFSTIPFAETDLPKLAKLGLSVTPVKGTAEKIALFCRLYEQHVKIKYKVSGADTGKIKHIAVTEPILVHYFSSENFLFKNKYSISNLVKYWNELQAEIITNSKGSYPDQWSEAFEAKLTSQLELTKYWAHLRSCGLEVKKDPRTGRVIDWVKKENLKM